MMGENEAVNKFLVERYGTLSDEVEKAQSVVMEKEIKELSDSSADQSSSSHCLEHLILVFAMGLATYVGVATRIGLSLLSEWINVEHFPSLYAQIVGTFIMGLLLPFKDNSKQNYATLYTSLSTGLCGCITTFSSWNAEAVSVLLQLNETSLHFLSVEDNGARVIGSWIVLLLGVGMPLSALRLGKNVGLAAQAVDAYGGKQLRGNRRRWLSLPIGNCAQSCTVLAWIGATALIICICIYYANFETMFALLLGPAGTYIRWQLGELDKKTKQFAREFPVGTFIANITGSFVLAFTLVCKAYFIESAGSIPYSLLAGVAVGFCGCLTTVSTFASQLSSLPFIMAITYTLCSIMVAQVEFICVLGGYAWTSNSTFT